METMRLGRNDLCRCGSGKKFKKCCLARQPPTSPITTYRAPPPPPRHEPPPGEPIISPSQHSFEWNEYVFVKDKGWTHESDLKPGDQYRLKGGGWETVPPDRVIGTTHEHPFYVQGKGWTPAGQLKPGDLVRTVDGWVPVKSVEDTGRYETVYNLRVAEHHTYFVGAPEWGFAVWAHNADCAILVKEGEKFILKSRVDGRILAEGTEADVRAFAQANKHTITAQPNATPGPYAHLSDGTKVEPGRAFQTQQREAILEANRQKNGGKLISDDPNDPWFGKELQGPGPRRFGGDTVPPNEAQIDHIIPRTGPDGKPLGTNDYSNARVISAEYNNFLRNKKPPKPP